MTNIHPTIAQALAPMRPRNYNDDDRYLIHDETGKFVTLGAKERGGTWMSGMSAKYWKPQGAKQ